MEILTISNSKIKISLSRSETEDYSLKSDNLDYDTAEVRCAVWRILDKAKQISGFDAAKSKILLQMFTSPSGGCEMFVTRIEGKGSDSVIYSHDPLSTVQTFVYAFEDLSCLIKGCRLLYDMGYSYKSSLYSGSNSYFIALACPHSPHSAHVCDISYPDLLCEFGTPIDSEYAKEYINEHLTCLCTDNAVEHIAKL